MTRTDNSSLDRKGLPLASHLRQQQTRNLTGRKIIFEDRVLHPHISIPVHFHPWTQGKNTRHRIAAGLTDELLLANIFEDSRNTRWQRIEEATSMAIELRVPERVTRATVMICHGKTCQRYQMLLSMESHRNKTGIIGTDLVCALK